MHNLIEDSPVTWYTLLAISLIVYVMIVGYLNSFINPKE